MGPTYPRVSIKVGSWKLQTGETKKPQTQAALGQHLPSPCSGTFSIPQSPTTLPAKFSALRSSKGFYKVTLHKARSFHGAQLQASSPKYYFCISQAISLQRPPNMVFRSLALLLCGYGKTDDPSFLIHKTGTQQSLAPWNCFVAYMK